MSDVELRGADDTVWHLVMLPDGGRFILPPGINVLAALDGMRGIVSVEELDNATITPLEDTHDTDDRPGRCCPCG